MQQQIGTAKFANQIFNLLKQVPESRVTTYKELAQALGTKAYQAVGQILKNNPYAPQVPCHRVVKSDGQIGGFAGQTSGPKIKQKIKLLTKEGVQIKNNKIINFKKILFKF